MIPPACRRALFADGEFSRGREKEAVQMGVTGVG